MGSAVFMVASARWLATRTFSPHGLLCEAAPPAPYMVIGWYASKFYEWVDTALLLAAKKEMCAPQAEPPSVPARPVAPPSPPPADTCACPPVPRSTSTTT